MKEGAVKGAVKGAIEKFDEVILLSRLTKHP
jgi:hypothetical protein